MNRLVILSLTIASLVSSCSCELKLFDDYLDVSVREGPPISSFVSVLEELDLKSAASLADIPEVMRKQLPEEASGEEEKFLSDTLGHLIDLAEDKKECSKKMVPAFVTAVNAVGELKHDAGEDKVKLLQSYLIENGRRRFAKCAISALRELTEFMTRRQAIEELKMVDTIFRRGLSMPGRYTLEEFYGKMKAYHPATDKTSVGKLINDSVSTLGYDPGERTFNLYRLTCKLFWWRYENWLDILNVARILNPDLELFKNNVRMLALNERHRVCIELTKNPDAFQAQLQKATRWHHEWVVDF